MPDLPSVHNPRKTRHLTLREQAKRRSKNRLYATNHPTWRKLRATILANEPLCRPCKAQGITTAATEVDHIDGNDANNTTENLQPICKPCHARLTQAHDGGFGNPINRRNT